MSRDKGVGFVLVDAIASEAYVVTMVTCLLCENDLMANDLGIEEANDPMGEWAQKFSVAAKSAGWSVSEAGSIICPKCHD